MKISKEALFAFIALAVVAVGVVIYWQQQQIKQLSEGLASVNQADTNEKEAIQAWNNRTKAGFVVDRS